MVGPDWRVARFGQSERMKICAIAYFSITSSHSVFARAHQIGLYEITEPSLPISFTWTKRPRSSYQMSCE